MRSKTVVRTRSPLLPFKFSTLAGGVMALGAAAVGASLMRIVIPRIAIDKASFGSVEVDTLTVRKLSVVSEEEPKRRRGRTKSEASRVSNGVRAH